MRSVSRCRRFATRIFLIPLVAGCGSADGPILMPVEGVVTIDSKPLDEATVSFVPDPSNKDITPGLGVSGVDGKFEVKNNGRFGLAPGRYKILISKTGAARPGVTVPKAFENDPLQQQFMKVRKETLPKKYSDPTAATEIVQVKDGDNRFDFDVKSQVAAKK